MKSTTNIEHELKQLRRLLLRLPVKNPPPGFSYGFDAFVVDNDLKIAFGSQATSNGSPICFKSHGPDLLAVVDVLTNAIMGTHGENPILLKWIVDLQAAANHAFDNPDSSNPGLPTEKRERKPTKKRVYMEAEAELKAGTQKQQTKAKAKTAEAQAQTELSFNFDPSKLESVPYPTQKSGRKTIPLLDRLTIYCRVTTDPTNTVRHWRCSGAGCPHSSADPRASERVLSHAMDCKFLSQELVAAASSASANRSLGAQLAALSLDSGKSSSRSQDLGEQPLVHSYFHQEGVKQRSLQHNHHALTAICVHLLPPTIVDSPYWKRMVLQLDPKINMKSGSNMAHSLIPAEAACVRGLSIKHLKQQSHLTLTCDGATL
ncbi:hypothetical protein RSOLAG22IIIB_11776 [Rhizoctonia solani]|uniref:Uncharacterized protein n=1 Tax=Rhizoctonia solani TaxID=456999 RepID=A0A0K6GAM2_9AGAM|nr:hypothetical protein RSOLAG22IIIB_11776 [Rhizoctonia solani]